MKEMKTNTDKRIILLVDDTPANIQMAHNILKDTYTTRIMHTRTPAPMKRV